MFGYHVCCEDQLCALLLVASPHVMGSGFIIGVVVGACIGTALLYTVILLLLICAVILWNKRRR